MKKLQTDLIMSLVTSLVVGFFLSITIIKKIFGEKTGVVNCSYVGKFGEKCSDSYYLNSYLPESLIVAFSIFILVFIYLYFFNKDK